MPASPYKRDRRYKSRLNAQSDAERVSMRERALEMASKGLNRRGGPVDKGPPEAQKRAAEQIRETANRQRQVASHGGSDTQNIRRVNEERPQDRRRVAESQVNRNEGNPRFGQRFRTIMRKGGAVHDYAGTKNDVFVKKSVKPESGGTHNRAMPRKTAGDSIDAQIQDLARQRATQNRPQARRQLFSTAKTSSYGSRDSDKGPQFIKPGSDIRSYRRQLRRQRQRSFQGPSRSMRA